MGISVCMLSSGSKGNATLIMGGSTKILVDNGLSLSYITEALDSVGINAKDINGILVTHRHTDHIIGVGTFAKKHGCKVCISATQRGEALKIGVPPSLVQTYIAEDFYLGDFTVSPFSVPHDVPCWGYSLYCEGNKVTVATDLGWVDSKTISCMEGSGLVVLESNHDWQMLSTNTNYSNQLKKRIASRMGHLSNDDCAEAVLELAKRGVNQVVLAHLSEENNYPELAFSTVAKRLDEGGFLEGQDVAISVAAQHKVSRMFKVG